MASTNGYVGPPPAPPGALGIRLGRERDRLSELEEQLATLRLEFAEVYRELYEGAQMQRHLSGPRLLSRGEFQIAAEIFPVRHLSGDFFNVSDLGRAALLAIGDIAGKGLLAAMWFTHVLGLTRMYGNTAPAPAAALAAINQQMCTAGNPPMTSVFLARLDYGSGELSYCNAGHPPPIVLRSNGTMHVLAEGGTLLGAMAEAQFTDGHATLEPGDTLVGYSDGLLECRDESGDEFGMERLLGEARKAAGLPTTAMLFSIIGAAQDFAGSNAREDDCTLMVVQRKAAEGV